MTSFRACTRDGSRWEDDPEAVSAMADSMKGIKKYTADSPTDGQAQ